MKKIIISMVALVLCSGPVFAQAFMNVSKGDFVSNISALNVTSIQEVELPKAVGVDKISIKKTEVKLSTPISKIKKTKGQYISLSGYVNLRGSGFMPSNGGYMSVYMSGSFTMRDISSGVTTNNVYLNENVSFWANENQYISQSVYINKYVSLYKDGRHVGSTNISGSISVSGWPSSNYVSLNGSGYLRGSFYLNETDKK
jgi:hypothetical protein